MTGMVTYVGLDVHARSTHAAAIDVSTGERCARGSDRASRSLSCGLRVCRGRCVLAMRPGRPGSGLYRAASAAGVAIEMIAPGKTPRGSSDRVKTDRKDAELLARLLLAGSLTAVMVPPVEVEAGRKLMRAHDACRRELRTASPRRARA